MLHRQYAADSNTANENFSFEIRRKCFCGSSYNVILDTLITFYYYYYYGYDGDCVNYNSDSVGRE